MIRARSVTAVAVAVLAGACAGPRPSARIAAILTAAEQTDYQATSTHAEVVSSLRKMAEASPHATYIPMGLSAEGREIPMLVLADPPVKTAREARERCELQGTITVLAIGNIHAGECDGKEALVMLARDLLNDPRPLRRVVVLLAPIYNPDGNERVAEGNRPGQNGPAKAGVRENAAGLDLNRDFIKAEAPETAALLATLNAWDPHVFIDTHITDGSFHRYLITYAGPKAPAGDADLIEWTRREAFPEIARRFTKRSGFDSFPYGNFEGEFGGAKGHTRWETFPAEARYGTTYVGLRGRVSVLVESYTYAPFRERVRATKEFVRAVIGWAEDDRRAITRRLAAIDRRATAMGATRDGAVAIRSKAAASPGLQTVLGYEEETRDGRTVPTPRHASYAVEMWDRFVPTLDVTRPAAYTFAGDAEGDRAAAKLRQHGILVTRVVDAKRVTGEAYTVQKATPSSRPFQGHVPVTIDVTAAATTIDLAPGDYVVRTAQPLGNLVVYLLEPASEDGLATWNYFDAAARPGSAWPVKRLDALP